MKTKRIYTEKSHPFYQKASWKKLSKQFKKANPLCKMCEDRGIVRVGVEVDHIMPISIDFDRRLDIENLQNLCRHHHRQKTICVDERLKKGLEPLPMKGTNSDGLPTDSSHFWNQKEEESESDTKEDEEEIIEI